MRIVAIGLVVCGFLGCEAGNTPSGDAQKTSEEIKKEAQSLTPADLEKVMARYNLEIEKVREKVTELEQRAKDLKVSDIFGEEGKKAVEGTKELWEELKKLKNRLAIYRDELASRK